MKGIQITQGDLFVNYNFSRQHKEKLANTGGRTQEMKRMKQLGIITNYFL